MRFSPSFLDDIRERVPISQVIGTRVTWDRRKSNPSKGDWWACCPFHGEKTPSFHCEDRKGRYHCFGCGVSGDHFRFLTELDGLGFPEAVERVADMAGVALPARDPESEARAKERASLVDVMEMATAFFEERLQGPDGAPARAYLRQRGLSAAIQREFRLGFAPDSRNALKEHLAGRGIARDQIEACGLVRHGPDIPVSYDWFRDRIMFPIEDSRGRTIAFGGRAMAAGAPAKYMNSPDTELFHKGEVLFNFARARKAIEKGASIVAVEGYMDVIALAEAGFPQAVAPLGTALTERQLELLWRISPEPVLCFDGDQAGQRAAWRAAELALPMVGAGRSVRFALMPEGKDPDDLVRQDGAAAFREVLEGARPLVDLVWGRETSSGVFDTPERRAALEKRLRDLTGLIRDESLRRHYGQEMRQRLDAMFGQRKGRDRQSPGERGAPSQRSGSAAQRVPVSASLARSSLMKGSTGLPVRETAILVAFVNHPGLIDEHAETLERLELGHDDLIGLHRALLDLMADGGAHQRTEIVEAFRLQGLGEAWERALTQVRRASLWPVLADAHLEDCREALQQALHLHLSSRALHKELRMAEALLAQEPTEENFRQMVAIQSQLRDAQAPEALIEGFGTLSGRAGRQE